ncbi:uncharacterized protein LOC105391536 [Plutella xylostella]|uniref:uncharacterized protein LOC105391536 n=1 Tax=Plutella xylostella TaxID=51655 RepID=UPI002032C7ED|nr:uncharacterized protein LOC105391536 [Plutella xylostella]
MTLFSASVTTVVGKTNLAMDPAGHSEEKRSSNGSLKVMNPVASGDNVAAGRNSTLKDELPPLIPCCEGKELQINEELVRSGLSAISVRNESLLRINEKNPGNSLFTHRNSFRCLHRPELRRVPRLRRARAEDLESIFREVCEAPPQPSTERRAEHRHDTHKLAPKPAKETPSAKEKEGAKETDLCSTLPPVSMSRRHEDIPAGKRLHVARARLYTSVLAAAKTGDQLDGVSVNEEYDQQVHSEDPVPEDEVQRSEELQVILPPRVDDALSVTTAMSCDPSVLM